MATRRMSSCELDDPTSIARKWAVTGTITVPSTGLGGTGEVRQTCGAQCLETLTPHAEYHIGVRFTHEGAPASNRYWLALGTGSIAVYLGLDGAGRLTITHSSFGLLWTGSTILLSGKRYYVEFSVKINSSTGFAGAYINGSPTPDATLFSGNTGTGNLSLLSFGVNGQDTSLTFRWQHYYANDGSGSAPNNTRWGDTKIVARLPVSDGHSADFTPSTGTDNFAMVDDATTDDDTTTVESTGGRDTYNFDPLGFTAETIRAVALNLTAKRVDASDLTLAGAAYVGTTDYETAAISPGTDYQVYEFLWGQSPDTSTAWDQTELEAAEFGPLVA